MNQSPPVSPRLAVASVRMTPNSQKDTSSRSQSPLEELHLGEPKYPGGPSLPEAVMHRPPEGVAYSNPSIPTARRTSVADTEFFGYKLDGKDVESTHLDIGDKVESVPQSEIVYFYESPLDQVAQFYATEPAPPIPFINHPRSAGGTPVDAQKLNQLNRLRTIPHVESIFSSLSEAEKNNILLWSTGEIIEILEKPTVNEARSTWAEMTRYHRDALTYSRYPDEPVMPRKSGVTCTDLARTICVPPTNRLITWYLGGAFVVLGMPLVGVGAATGEVCTVATGAIFEFGGCCCCGSVVYPRCRNIAAGRPVDVLFAVVPSPAFAGEAAAGRSDDGAPVQQSFDSTSPRNT